MTVMLWTLYASFVVCFLSLNGQAKKTIFGNKEEATLIFAGDITFDGPVKYFAEVNKTCGYERPFQKIKKYLEEADIRIANMESPLSKKAKKFKFGLPNKSIHHVGRTKAVKGLLYAGFDLVQLANNHIADFGPDAISSTVEVLEESGISYVGLVNASKSKGVHEPYIKVINGVRIGFLAYCWNTEGCSAMRQCRKPGKCKSDPGLDRLGPATLKTGRTLKEIQRLKQRVDIVVVLMHWGKELEIVPSIRVRKVAMEMSMAGANLIIGTHPHVVQGHECMGTRTLVVYSLGNLLLPKAQSINENFLADRQISKGEAEAYLKKMKSTFNLSQQAYIFRIKVSRKSIIGAEYLPIEIVNEEETNCLQPTPKGQWQQFCVTEDLYCYDFTKIYAESAKEFEEQNNALRINRNFCVKG